MLQIQVSLGCKSQVAVTLSGGRNNQGRAPIGCRRTAAGSSNPVPAEYKIFP